LNPVINVHFANGLFFALSNNGDISTSPDGLNFTLRSSGTTSNLFAMASSPTLHVVLLSSGPVTTSPDGITWTLRTTNLAANGSALHFANGLFVAANSAAAIVTSPDGITWTARVSNVSGQINSITFGAGLFVAVTSAGTITTSPDGITWTARVVTPNVSTLNHVAHSAAAGAFLAVGANGHAVASADGITWLNRSTPGYTNIWSKSVYFNNSWVVVGANAVGRSDNILSNPVTLRPFPIAQTQYMALQLGTRLVALGQAYMSTTDGLNWIASQLFRFSTMSNVAGINNDGPKTLLYSNGGQIAITTDGVTFSIRTIGTTTNITDMAYGLGMWVAVTSSNIFTSTDGLDWTPRLIIGTSLNAVTFGGGAFVVVGTSGTTLRSTDGINWTPGYTAVSNMIAVTFGNGVYVAASNSNIVAVSANGITWKARAVGTLVQHSNVVFGNGVFVVAGGSGMYTSTNGQKWTFTQNMPVSFACLVFTANHFIGVTNGGAVAISKDGRSWSLLESKMPSIGSAVASLTFRMARVGDELYFPLSSRANQDYAEGFVRVPLYTYSTATQFFVPPVPSAGAHVAFVKATV